MYGHGFATLFLAEVYGMSPDSVCLVLASTHYDMNRSLRSGEYGTRIRNQERNHRNCERTVPGLRYRLAPSDEFSRLRTLALDLSDCDATL